MNALRRFVSLYILVAFAGFCLFVLCSCLLPLTEWSRPDADRMLQVPCDFRLRLNELDCLRDGVNPYDVWHGDVVKKPYYPHNVPSMASSEFNEPINAYTPWGYTMALPLSYLPRKPAWGAYVAFMLVCLGVMAWGGYGIGCRHGGSRTGILFATLPLLVVAYPIWSNFNIGNYAVPILASVFMMCWCLDRGHDMWAGVFWSLAMIKPQNSLLLAVPLLMRGKIRCCVVAAVICIVATVLPAVMCGTSPIVMILQAPAASAHGFHGCGALPSYASTIVGDRLAMPLAGIIGLIVCVALTWRIRRVGGWVLFVMPAVMCSISWTYITSYSFSMVWFLCVAIMMAWTKQGRSPALVAFTAFAGVLLPRFFTCWHGAASAFGLATVSEPVFHAIDTTVSLLVLLLTIAFCLWLPRDLQNAE